MSSSSTTTIYALDDQTQENNKQDEGMTIAQVGGKALNLMHLFKCNVHEEKAEIASDSNNNNNSDIRMPIPQGIVLSVSFFEPWMTEMESTNEWKSFLESVAAQGAAEQQQEEEGPGSTPSTKEYCDALKERCTKLKLSEAQQAELDSSINAAFFSSSSSSSDSSSSNNNNDEMVLVAVRSSSPEEDLSKMSFAGGYETTLAVRLFKAGGDNGNDNEELMGAILHSFASAFDNRVVQYKLQNNSIQRNTSNNVNNDKDHPSPLLLLQTLPRIAVMIQRQIDAAVSGVAFSLNPLNNCYDEAVISSNFGLGESVVSGVVTPDEFVVDKYQKKILSKKISSNKGTCVHKLNEDSSKGGVQVVVHQQEEKKDEIIDSEAVSSSSAAPSEATTEQLSLTDAAMAPSEATMEEPSLTEEQVFQVTDLLSLVEEKMGMPVDIEWAIEQDGKLYLLQARPITTYFSLFPELVTAPQRGGEQGQEAQQDKKRLYIDLIALSQGFSDPLSPLGLDFWQRMLTVAKPHMTHGQDGMVLEIHGREYIIASNLLACTMGDSLVKNLFLAQGGKMVRIWESIDMEEYRPEAVTPKNKPVVWRFFQQFIKMIPDTLRGLWDPSRSMKAYLDECEKVFERFQVGGTEESSQGEALDNPCTYLEEFEKCLDCCRAMFPLISSIMASFYSKWRLNRMFAGNSEAQDLLVTLNMDLDGNPTSEMGHEMLRLASFPEIQQTESADEFLSKINDSNSSYSDEFRAAYDRFILRFGCRGMREIDMATPRSRESQGDLFLRIKMIDVDNNQILTVKKRKEEAQQKLLAFAAQAGKESAFKYHSEVIQRTGGYREHPKYMFVFLVDYLRRRALKQGADWVKEDRLEKVEDIFFLTAEQVTSGQLDAKVDLKQLVAENRAPYDACAHVKSWPVVVDSRGKIFRGAAPPVEGGLSGDPISHGVVRGKAKVLQSPYEKRVNPGEILVTRATEPSWTPIFINAAGVVLEVGGPLQHGAIIAREYGIPCVSGVEEATTKIHDGDLLEVDGTNGVVKILTDQDEPESNQGDSVGLEVNAN